MVTADKAALATDGRYFNQAATQLDDNWTLLKQGMPDVPTWQEWCAEQCAGGKVAGVDPHLLSNAAACKLAERIQKAGGRELRAVDHNLVDGVWGSSRPTRPNKPVVPLAEKFSGKDVATKLKALRADIEKKKARAFVASALDEVAWLFNLRGSDIPYNPVFFSYALVTPDSATLYVNEEALGSDAREHLAANNVTVKPYGDVIGDAQQLSVQAKQAQADGSDLTVAAAGKFLLSTRASWALHRALGGESMVDEARSPITNAKAVKNETELQGMRACHIRDGAALIEFFAWLEDQLVGKQATIDEVQAADKLEAIRSKHENFVGLSFDTISSTGPK